MNEDSTESMDEPRPRLETQAPVQQGDQPEQLREQNSPGHILANARRAQNVSLEELSAQTMLGRDTVSALENNDFGRMSQPVFVRGYYRKCAKVLGLSEDAIMDAYAAWTGVAGPKPVPSSRVDVVPQDVTPGGSSPLRLLLVVVGVVIIAVFAWQFLPASERSNEASVGSAVADDVSSPEPGQTKPEPPDEPAPASSPDVPEISEAQTGAAAQPTEPDVPSAQASTNVPAEPAPESEPTQAGPADGTLHLRFTQRSWIDVRDANNKSMLTGIVPADSERIIDKGTPPYKIALGYAPGVEVYVGDQRIDLADKTKSDNTARFTVEPGQ